MRVAHFSVLWTTLLGLLAASPVTNTSLHPGSRLHHESNTPPNLLPRELHPNHDSADIKPTVPTTPSSDTASQVSWRFAHSGDWVNKPCTDKGTDARAGTWWDWWTESEVPTAWHQLFENFKKDRNNKAMNPLSLDAWIWNAFWADDPYCRVHNSGSCKVPTCDPKRLPEAAQYIMKSFAQVNQLITTAWDNFVMASIIEVTDLQDFVETFAQRNPRLDEKAAKGIIDAAMAAVGIGSAVLWNDIFKEAKVFPQYLKEKPSVKAPKPDPNDKNFEPKPTQEGNERSVWKDIANAAIGASFTGAKDSMSAAEDPMMETYGKMQHIASGYFQATSKAIIHQLNSFMWANDSKTQDQVYSMLVDGGLYNLSNVFANNPESLQRNQNQTFWGTMLPHVWDLSDELMNPFILRADHKHWKCGDKTKPHGGRWAKADPLPKWYMGQYMDPRTNEATYWCDSDDKDKANTFWLLNANYKACNNGVCANGAYIFTELKGGNRDTLNGEKWYLSMEDIITSAYGGFLHNGKRNGYKMAERSSLVVTENWSIEDFGWPFQANARTPGFFNFNICLDPKEAMDRIKNGIKPPCGEVPKGDDDISGYPNDAGYIAGWCTIHITQFQPNLKDDKGKMSQQNVNPLHGYQIAAAIYQADSSALVFATKQPIDGTLAVKSKLPHTLYVQDNYKNENGDDMLAFWYNDQFWLQNSTEHQCSDPEVWDGGKREFSTGFTCANPKDDPKKKPPVPVPKHIVPAYYGTTDPKLATNVKSYAKGKCEIHIRQYQQHEMANALNAGTYALEITIWDDDKHLIAYTPKANKPPGIKHTVSVKGPLPWIVMCWSGTDNGKGNNDKPLPMCKYGAEKFAVGADKSKNLGVGYKEGMRDLWATFKC